MHGALHVDKLSPWYQQNNRHSVHSTSSTCHTGSVLIEQVLYQELFNILW